MTTDRPDISFELKREAEVEKLRGEQRRLLNFLESLPEPHLSNSLGSKGDAFRPLIESIKKSLELAIQRAGLATQEYKYAHLSGQKAEEVVNHLIELYKLIEIDNV